LNGVCPFVHDDYYDGLAMVCHGNGGNGGKKIYSGGEFLTAKTLFVVKSTLPAPLSAFFRSGCS
jgi:hypothetical protein